MDARVFGNRVHTLLNLEVIPAEIIGCGFWHLSYDLHAICVWCTQFLPLMKNDYNQRGGLYCMSRKELCHNRHATHLLARIVWETITLHTNAYL